MGTTPTTRARAAPTPGSEHAGPLLVAVGAHDDSVLVAARLLAPRLGTTPTVVTVVDAPPAIDESSDGDALDRLRRRARAAGGAGTEWSVELLHGRAARAIARAARARTARLVVMGLGRHRATDRLFGETALRTIRLARRPVLAVSPRFRALPRCVVAAVDFGAASVAAVKATLPLIADDATVYLVHAWERAERTRRAPPARDAAYERRLPELFAQLAREIAAPPGLAVRAVPLVGKPAEEVLVFAEGHRADLIVCGTHVRGFVDRLLVRSVASELLRGATCSVLVTAEPSAAEPAQAEPGAASTYESHAPGAWAAQLEGFARRNAGRPTALDIYDLRLGAQRQEAGYALLGATYDRHDRRAELMLGDTGGGTRHLTHTVAGVEAVATATAPDGRDAALWLTHDYQQTLLTFTDTNAARARGESP